jgi:hypothetical protein
MTPRISAICVTFGRTAFLQNAIRCFMDQDYENKELLILNTCPEQKLRLSEPSPGVVIRNLDVRPPALGLARNIAIETATGDFCVVWDDDDACLPFHLSTFGKHLPGNDWLHLGSMFYSEGYKIKKVCPGQLPTFGFSKRAWEELGGYPALTVGEDRQFIGRVTQQFKGKQIPLRPDQISYIYRWQQSGVINASGGGDDAPGKVSAHDRIAAHFQSRVKRGLEPTGHIELKPQYLDLSPVGMVKTFFTETSGSAESKKKSCCIVQLGRFGDIINILPIAKHIAETYGRPYLMVSREFAGLLDGCSYVEPYPVPLANDQINEAMEIARREFSRVVQTQIWGKNFSIEKQTTAYNRESWKQAGFDHQFENPNWFPLFDQRDMKREAAFRKKVNPSGKPLIVVNVTKSISSPFQGEAVLTAIRNAFTEYEIVDVSQLVLPQFYDLLGIIEEAAAVVSIDTSLLHIAAATHTPVVALINSQPWLGTSPRCRCVKIIDYKNANPANVCTALEETICADYVAIHAGSLCTSLKSTEVSMAPARNLYHCVERHEEPDPRQRHRKQLAQRSWDVLYSQHGVIPCHLWEQSYPRTAKDLGDRPLPYLKDVLKFGMDQAGENDILFWTNDDDFLHPTLADSLRFHVSVYGACTLQRCEFMEELPAPTATREEFVRRSRSHMGRDLFAATKGWLLAHWDSIPDFILGCSEFDLCLACLVRKYFQLPANRANIEATMFPAEMPRGFVSHQHHLAHWTLNHYTWTSPAQSWNRERFKEWASAHLPQGTFTPP